MRYSGEDIKVNITVTDEDGNQINLDVLDELYVYIYFTSDEILKYSKAGEGDYTALVVENPTVYTAWVDSSFTEGKSGTMYVEVNAVEPETHLNDDIRNYIAKAEITNFNTSLIEAES